MARAPTLPHKAKVDRHNILAARRGDTIELDEKEQFVKKKQKRRRGKQALQASAILRLCFGFRLFDPPKKRTRIKSKSSNPHGASARICAEVFSASHTHVQHCRNAVSKWIVARQDEQTCKLFSEKVSLKLNLIINASIFFIVLFHNRIATAATTYSHHLQPHPK